MATLPSLRPNSDVLTSADIVDASLAVPAQYWAEVNDDPDSGAVGGTLQNAGDSIGTVTIHLGTTDTPIDFLSMDSVVAKLYIEAVNYADDQGVLDVFIGHDSLGALTTTETVYDFAVDGNTSGIFDVPLTLTAAGESATKSDWDSAHIGMTWTNNKNMAGDDGKTRVMGVEINGVFTQTPPTVFMDASSTVTVDAWASTTANASLTSNAYSSPTAFREQFAAATSLLANVGVSIQPIAIALGSMVVLSQGDFVADVSPQTMYSSASVAGNAYASGDGSRGYTYQGYDFGYMSYFDEINGEAVVSSTSTLSASARLTRVAQASLSAGANVTAGAGIVFFGGASIAADSTATISGDIAVAGNASISAASTMSVGADVYVYSSPALVATSEFTTTGIVIKSGSAAIAAAGYLNAKDDSTHLVTVSFAASASVSASAFLARVASLALAGVATLTVIVRETIYAYSFFILPQEGASQLIFQGFHGDPIHTNAVGSDVFVEIGTHQSPALDPDAWYFVLLNDGTWTVERLGASEHSGLLVQNVGMFSDPLTTDESDDMISMATSGVIVRGVDDTSTTIISDGGAVGIAANWHRRKIT